VFLFTRYSRAFPCGGYGVIPSGLLGYNTENLAMDTSWYRVLRVSFSLYVKDFFCGFKKLNRNASVVMGQGGKRQFTTSGIVWRVG
jgi:hypothetical protein